jgi:hypothetical protein
VTKQFRLFLIFIARAEMADHMPLIDEDWEEWDPSKGSFMHHMIAGSCAGVMEHVAMFPLDTYKVSDHVSQQ